MRKISISLYLIFLLTMAGHVALAQSNAADAAAVFSAAGDLFDLYKENTDTAVTSALTTLKKIVEDGNRALLNRNIDEARALAEQVSAQMELVRLLSMLAETKNRLNQLQIKSQTLIEEKKRLEAQYRHLVLLRDGRVMTGAFPAPENKGGGEQ